MTSQTIIENMQNQNTRRTSAAIKYEAALKRLAAEKRFETQRLQEQLAEADHAVLIREIVIFAMTVALFIAMYHS